MCVKRLCCKLDWRIASIVPALTVTLFLTACGYRFWEPRAPERSFTPEDLLIDQGIVPQSCELSNPIFPAGDELCTTECAAIRFAVTNDHQLIRGGTHSVYRYLSAGIARRTFDKVYLATARSLDSVSEWTYQSPVAEQSHFGCSNMAGSVGVACEWAGRYEEYIVVFGAVMLPGELSQANIE
jgi:hypothetical protein